MGKTQGGAVWLDPEKTTPFEFYQYWRNVDDADVLNCLRKMTFLPLEQIDEMKGWEGAELNRAKELLAWELTSLVHGRDEAMKAQLTAKALFSATGDADELPVTLLTADDLTDGAADILTLLVKTGLCPSKSDARRNIQQGGVTANDEKVTAVNRRYTSSELSGEGVLLRRGKKNYQRAVLR
jgi:tyrosyl-tRNA synthetase